ncbi:Hypp754 [Branchiostoma lanceolatum]|uniref:Hypp754 protein n=1 Tax=Branchiostoma lanceolatum TaxID=7740 RepID=A0A8J9W593_BRALA|nr:Hypp754 [Branchiostoma lanceolatum]
MSQGLYQEVDREVTKLEEANNRPETTAGNGIRASQASQCTHAGTRCGRAQQAGGHSAPSVAQPGALAPRGGGGNSK